MIQSTDKNPTPVASSLSEGRRTLLSLALIVHLVAMVLGLLSINRPAAIVHALQLRLFAPYTQTIGLDLNYDFTALPYYLTHGAQNDVDATLDIETAASPRTLVISFPDRGSPGSLRFQRELNLVSFMASFSGENQESRPQTPTELARSAGGRLLREQNLSQAEIVCRLHLIPQLREFQEGTAENDPASRLVSAFAYGASLESDSRECYVTADASTVEIAPVKTSSGRGP